MRRALDKDLLIQIYNRISVRYDLQHTVITAGADGRGRRLVVKHAVHKNDIVLDAGAGTGSTALLAAKKAGANGKVTALDMNESMLSEAKHKAEKAGLSDRMIFKTGDMERLPFDDNTFDAVLSTYSLCPLFDPEKGALELYRVTKPCGRIGIAHSAEPSGKAIKWLADKVENIAWRIPSLSMGCRAVSTLPTFKQAGACVLFEHRLGIPLWPFIVFVLKKPHAGA